MGILLVRPSSRPRRRPRPRFPIEHRRSRSRPAGEDLLEQAVGGRKRHPVFLGIERLIEHRWGYVTGVLFEKSRAVGQAFQPDIVALVRLESLTYTLRACGNAALAWEKSKQRLPAARRTCGRVTPCPDFPASFRSSTGGFASLASVRARSDRTTSGGKDAYRIMGGRRRLALLRTRRTAFPGRRFRADQDGQGRPSYLVSAAPHHLGSSLAKRVAPVPRHFPRIVEILSGRRTRRIRSH